MILSWYKTFYVESSIRKLRKVSKNEFGSKIILLTTKANGFVIWSSPIKKKKKWKFEQRLNLLKKIYIANHISFSYSSII